MSPRVDALHIAPPLALFTRTAERVSRGVIADYSTSFALATRMLGAQYRSHVRNVYALVRIADEIVDGVAEAAGLSRENQRASLDRYEDETHRAMKSGYSSDLIIHAFATTARHIGIDEALTRPFFSSMRTDLTDGITASFDEDQHADYVFGSAEVVGLMCLRVFLHDQRVTQDQRARLEFGARELGAAFQNINFLRDLADDTERLNRQYLGGSGRLSDTDRDRWVATIQTQLAHATEVIPLLPIDARTAVRSAHSLFAVLTRRVARTPAVDLYRTRIRVPDTLKLWLVLRARLATLREGRR